jgi:hypothetical protein
MLKIMLKEANSQHKQYLKRNNYIMNSVSQNKQYNNLLINTVYKYLIASSFLSKPNQFSITV